MNSRDKEAFNRFRQDLKASYKNYRLILANPQNKPKEGFPLPPEIEATICSPTPINHRIATLEELGQLVLLYKLEEYALETLCARTEDLLRSPNREHRHAVLNFYQHLIQGQFNSLGIIRAWFFHVIKSTDHKEDMGVKFELFQKLTDNGKVMTYFEEEVGPFLMLSIQDIISHKKSLELLQVLVNYIKYNAAYIDDEVMKDIVQYTAYIVRTNSVADVIRTGLDVFDTIVRYSNIPQETISIFISTLSKTALMDAYDESSWKIMRNLLGTHMGHFCLREMCKLLRDDKSYVDVALVIGTHFFVNMALLYNKPEFVIGYIPSFILPSFEKTADSNIPMVLNEACAGFKWLIEKYGKDLTFPSWVRIIFALDCMLNKISNTRQKELFQPNIYELFNKIETLFESGQFRGDPADFYKVCFRWHLMLPEPTIKRLLNHCIDFVMPIEKDWIDHLLTLMKNFYNNENRSSLRIHMLIIFEDTLMTNRYLHEKSLIDVVLIPFFENIVLEEDDLLRKAVIEFLLRFSLQCRNDYMESMLNILEKVLETPFTGEEIAGRYQRNYTDIETTLKGLIYILSVSIYQLPSSNAIKILSMLVTFLRNHYKKPGIFDSAYQLRLMVAQCILKLRIDTKYRLGYCSEKSEFKASTFLVAERKRVPNISLLLPNLDVCSSPGALKEKGYVPNYITYVNLSDACEAIAIVLKNERDWRVLEPILRSVPTALKYRALITSHVRSDIDTLVEALIFMFRKKNLPDKLENVPPKFMKTDFFCIVMPVVSAFASLHAHLDAKKQRKIILSLEIGLVYRSAARCLSALTVCLLEMKEAMVIVIREVLLSLSKLSATKYVAIASLQFLSLLAFSPTVYANFTSTQFLSIFAIVFPYTNPFEYHHFVVSLAYHVIATWFFKCKRPLRPDFVKYIIRGLRRNVGNRRPNVGNARQSVNEDSSNRKRSSSLTEQGNLKKTRLTSSSGRLSASMRTPTRDQNLNETLVSFHRELTDTCLDLMSRVTFKACPAIPRRDDHLSRYLFADGITSTWIIGLSLVSVTVSGCKIKPYHNGLCERCCNTCTIDPEVYGISKFYQNCLKRESECKDKQNEPSVSRPTISIERIPENLSKQNSSVNQSTSSSPITSSSNLSGNDEDEPPIENVGKKDELQIGELQKLDQCVCWCQNWAEIYIRRPTGDLNWIMRTRNDVSLIAKCDPFTDVNAAYQASTNEESNKEVVSESFLRDYLAELSESEAPVRFSQNVIKQEDTSDIAEAMSELRFHLVESSYEEFPQGRNLVKRSNSSPEMSSNWKNAYMKDSSRSFTSSPVSELDQIENTSTTPENRKPGKCYQKDLRGNCEAIPEEIFGQGTTPPKYGPLKISKVVDSDMSVHSSCVPSREKSSEPNSSTSVLPSVSFEANERRLENRFFDNQSMPNEHFEFNRSASVSQVVPPFKRSAAAYSAVTSLASSQPHLTTKPPLSPPTFVSRYSKHPKDPSDFSFSHFNQDYKRDRVHTISVMSSTMAERKKPTLSPSSVFLQLYYASQLNNAPEQPLLIPSVPSLQMAVDIFDLIPPYETYKVGVIYVGPGQINNEAEILKNTHGSIRYHEFINNLGSLITLADENPQITFLGGLEQNGSDGQYAYVWKDDVIQVIFHVATLMPTKETDPNGNNKKRHIGNDYVTIVYNDSGEEYDLQTLKCQFSFGCVIIEPLELGSNQLSVKARPDLKELIGDIETKIVSDANVALLARQFALHINLASVILCKQKKNEIYASNWHERYRKIKHIKSKVQDELAAREKEEEPEDADLPEGSDLGTDMQNFTEYIPPVHLR